MPTGDGGDPYLTAEARARVQIDAQLETCGWAVQNARSMNLYGRQGVAVREFTLARGHGEADYLLFVDQRAVGVVEAKKLGSTLAGVELQSAKYSGGLPENLHAPHRPLPFLYESTGAETYFTNLLDPEPRSRTVRAFHRPETLAAWLRDLAGHPDAPTLRGRYATMPELANTGLWPAQVRAIHAMEGSLLKNHPRALLQMTMGAGKTRTAANEVYRLIKFGGAERILFLVDRRGLGDQALTEFEQFVTPDDGRKFTDLYGVKLLTSNVIDAAPKVVITTIQRLYSILRGEAELDPEVDELSGGDVAPSRPVEVSYNPRVPIEFFDNIIVDECHRSIYGVWSQVLEYFDAFITGLTATPTKQTFGFFRQNLVFEYSHAEAVIDKVNVDFDVFRLRTRITQQGSTVEADVVTRYRNRQTREPRYALLEGDFTYDANALDRTVVADDQIRTILEYVRDHFNTIFPGRTVLPKTLIFAKDDSHAEDIVRVAREVFGVGNEFAQKITYHTTGAKPKQLLADLRNEFYPRIAVTVDMIATGTDIKPLELLVFMRAVKSPTYFEQMKGRGVRVINDNDLQAVTPGAVKDRFVIFDCVGVTEQDRQETTPLERRPFVTFEKLLRQVAAGDRSPETASSLASRLARLNLRITADDRAEVAGVAHGTDIAEIARALVRAVDPDHQLAAVLETGSTDATTADLEEQANVMIEAALLPLASNPELRQKLIDVRQSYEQFLDYTSQDEVTEAGFTLTVEDRALTTTQSWRQFIVENKDAISALHILYDRPYGQRLTHREVKELAAAISRPPQSWTAERLWKAYEALDASRVRGDGGRVLADLVSLVRFALEQDNQLVPFSETVGERFDGWLLQQEQAGKTFSPAQLQWLHRIRDHLATSLTIEAEDFEYVPFVDHGGLGRATEVFGPGLDSLLEELNQMVAV